MKMVESGLVPEHGGQALVAAETVGDVEGQLQRLLAVQPVVGIVFVGAFCVRVGGGGGGGVDKSRSDPRKSNVGYSQPKDNIFQGGGGR